MSDPSGEQPNDNVPDNNVLDDNLSRLLSNHDETPKLSPDEENVMLDTLKSKQSEMYGKKDATKDELVLENPWREKVALKDEMALEKPWQNQFFPWICGFFLLFLVMFAAWFAFIVGKGNQQVVENLGNQPGTLPIATEQVKRSKLEDGTLLIAHKGTKYTVNKARQITLETGDIYLIVAKSRNPFVVKTSDGEVRATGTRFAVSTGKKTTAAVSQGRVTLKGDRGKVELRAGQQGSLQKGKRPTRSPAPRMSYLVSWAKEALSQDELLVEKNESKDGLIAVDPWGQESRLTLRKYNVDVYIEDGIARTTIDQTFFNHYPWNTEGTFYFPLPPDASVSRLAMYVNGQLNEGGMVERGRGQAIYNDILYQQRDPALLEMMEGNVFKMRIFPLEGRQEKRIFLSYTQKLEELYGTMRYWFPMDHTNSVAKQLSIRVHVKDGAETFDPRSSTHKFTTKTDGKDLVLEYAAQKIKPDQDLLLHLTPSKPSDATRVATCEKDGYKFVFARLTPKIPGEVEPKPRQWIVLNDVSASRSKIEAKAQRYILQRLLDEADDEDSVFQIDLNTRATLVSSKFSPVRSDEAKKLLEHRVEAHLGATNIAAGIEAVGKVIKQHKVDNPHILYLGDGMATDGQTEVFSLVRAIPRGSTFVGVGVGKKVDSLFLQTAADQTGGVFATINPDEDIDWRVFDLISALNTPRMTKIRAKLLDEGGKELGIDTIAYPSSRSLSDGETLTVVARCEKEFPAKIVFEGKVGSKSVPIEASLANAKSNTEYIPRLWAKRHIDELTKSDMERSNEIIELSKQYYVVTPFTSLIVLEDDAMYAEYKVERGRKDHWALYNAPKKIEVVKEPVDWNRWAWWGAPVGRDARIEAAEKPKSVQEIVESVQFRINAPFYYYPRSPQYGQGRYAFYELLDRNTDPTRLLTYWTLLAAGEKEAAARVRRIERTADQTDASAASPGSEIPALTKYDKRLVPLLMGLDSFDQPHAPMILGEDVVAGDGLIPLTMMFGGSIPFTQESFGAGVPISGYFLLPQFVDFDANGVVDMPDLQPRTQLLTLGPMLMPPRVETARSRQKNLGWFLHSPVVSMKGGQQTDFQSSVRPELLRSFQAALGRRWWRIHRDVLRFNRQYGMWSDEGWKTWDIDLRRSVGETWYGGLDGLIEGGSESDEESLPLQMIVESESRLLTQFREDLFVGDRRRLRRDMIQTAVATVGVYDRSLKTLPGSCSVLAADHLVDRKNELQEKALALKGKQELAAIDKALSEIERASSRIEESGPFWSWQGWNYKPRPWTFQQPTIQAYYNYNWSYDLTRYTPGLYSTSFDILNEVVDQFSSPATATGRAVERIAEARRSIKPVKIRFEKDGQEFFVASGDRFAWKNKTNMYVNEHVVCDGKNIHHAYDMLGIASRRRATELRLASLRQYAPHLIQPANVLASQFKIDLADIDNEDGFSLNLTPKEQADDAKKSIQITIHVTPDGLIRSKVLKIGDEKRVKLNYEYGDGMITARWSGKDDKKLAEMKYYAEPLKDEDVFELDTSKYVVFNMPLRRPSYYQKHLAKLGGEELSEDDKLKKINLHRHHALSLVQELQWRRWGGTNSVAQQEMNQAFGLMKQAGQKAKVGDLTLLGSAGVYNTVAAITADKSFDDSHPVAIFYRNRRAGWNDVEKLKEEHSGTLVDHLATYHIATTKQPNDKGRYEYLIKEYSNSPLILAAAHYVGNRTGKSDAWLELLESPRWRGMAVMMSAGRWKSADHREKFANAFKLWKSELTKAGYETPITPAIASQLRELDSGELWQKIVRDRWDEIKESKAIAPLLRFAEDSMSWGETQLANEAFVLARERLNLDKHDSLLGRFALAQTYWASSRTKEALKLFDEILDSLAKKKVAPSPALLASVARLAQQSGDLDRAIELEERALAIEHKYLPEMINLQAFRQRYSWLWQQYQAKVTQAASEKNEKEVKRWITAAESAWHRWHEVDRDNMQMGQQMATLQMAAGRRDDAWLYLSTVIDQKPRDAQSHNAVAQWHRGRGELDRAQKRMAEAFRWDTANPQWLVQRGEILKQMGRNDQAREVYQQVVDGKWAQGLQGWVNRARKGLNK